MGLHVLLQRSLARGVDENLDESTELLGALLRSGLTDKLSFEDERLKNFSRDDVALIYNPAGEVVTTLGRVPYGFERPAAGFSTWHGWRVLRSAEQSNLVVMRNTADIEVTLQRFDTAFLWLAPLIIVLAFLIGYAFAATALAPVDRLTHAAYDLAQRSAWREVLPEPKHRDELWRLSRATNTLLEALARVIESERHFTADAAHELRTPLTALRGRLEKAWEQSSEDRVRLSLAKALTATEALGEVVEKLLLLARTEAGQGLTKQPLDLVEVVRAAAHRAEHLFSEKGLELNVSLPETPVMVLGDATAVELLLRNLLDNALKFTEQGAVGLELGGDAETVVLRVTDSGVGIPAEALPHLFERFYQGDVAHRRAGSGLGLAIAASVAAWHGGSLTAENLARGGSSFELRLPRFVL